MDKVKAGKVDGKQGCYCEEGNGGKLDYHKTTYLIIN